MSTNKLQIRALKTTQNEETVLYAFFIPGELIHCDSVSGVKGEYPLVV